MKLRSEQIATLRDAEEALFIRQLAAFLKKEHSDCFVRTTTGTFTVSQLSDNLLSTLVKNGIAKARAYSIDWQSTISAFVVLMFLTAPNFDEHPRIKTTLNDESMPPNLRLDQIWAETTPDDWRSVVQQYDPHFWHLSMHRSAKAFGP